MRDQYEYLSLGEAVLRKGEEVNFYGAVSEYEHPRHTRGSGELKFNLSVIIGSFLQSSVSPV